DESFFEKRGALPFAEALPRVKDNINVYGYPTGGSELSVTQGIVSRIEYTDYYYQTSGLRIQVDAALNFGNSGGPAVSDGKLVGLVFSLIQNAHRQRRQGCGPLRSAPFGTLPGPEAGQGRIY